MAFVYETERDACKPVDKKDQQIVGPGYNDPDRNYGFNKMQQEQKYEPYSFITQYGTSPFKSKVKRDDIFATGDGNDIGPGSYDDHRTQILPIKNSQYYYVLEEGKLKEKYQPFNKGEMRNKPFRMDPGPAPGSYNTEPIYVRTNRRSHAKLSVSKIDKNSIIKPIGPGHYNPNPRQIIKRNDVSVLKWKTYEKRSSSIMKDIQYFEENEDKIPGTCFSVNL